MRREQMTATAIRAGFALAVVLATEPVWSRAIFGYSPTFEELLLVRCLGVP